MKWYKVCNRISLLLHALCSALGYFLIEMISPPFFFGSMDIYDHETTCLCIQCCTDFYNFTDRVSFPQEMFLASSDLDLVAVAWYYQWSDPVQQGYSVYRTGSSSSDRRNGVLNKYLPAWGVVLALILLGLFCTAASVLLIKAPKYKRKVKFR